MWNIILSVLPKHHLLEARGFIHVILRSQTGPNSESSLVFNIYVKTGILFCLSESQFLHLWIGLLYRLNEKMQQIEFALSTHIRKKWEFPSKNTFYIRTKFLGSDTLREGKSVVREDFRQVEDFRLVEEGKIWTEKLGNAVSSIVGKKVKIRHGISENIRNL